MGRDSVNLGNPRNVAETDTDGGTDGERLPMTGRFGVVQGPIIRVVMNGEI